MVDEDVLGRQMNILQKVSLSLEHTHPSRLRRATFPYLGKAWHKTTLCVMPYRPTNTNLYLKPHHRGINKCLLPYKHRLLPAGASPLNTNLSTSL